MTTKKRNNIINIAYDRKNGTYLAYNVKEGIFATGVCVESACKSYRKKFKDKPYHDAVKDMVFDAVIKPLEAIANS